MAIERRYGFEPAYSYPPGETLAELLESRSMTQVELAERTGLTPKTINEVVKGKAMVTPDTALHLERVFGLPASFWNNLQRRFDEAAARSAEAARLKQSTEWAQRFPLRKMAAWGWLDLPTDRVDQVRAVLNYFGTATPAAWEARWEAVSVAFRSAAKFDTDRFALAAWLRQGESLAAKAPTEEYSATAFRSTLDDARRLSTLPDVGFLEPLQRMCAAAGVVVLFVPELPRIRVYGATRWLSAHKALIQLSLRQKSDDQLWFSFFHEAAHILLHPKKVVFLEQGNGDDELEHEADRFAGEHLIPPDLYHSFVAKGALDAGVIRAFAARLGVAPGIVVGRLQHDGHLPYKTVLNSLKRRYTFAGT